jgi:hypothetical protein
MNVCVNQDVTPVSFQINGAIYSYRAQERKILLGIESKRGKIVRAYTDGFRIKFAAAPYNITCIYIYVPRDVAKRPVNCM